MDILGLKKLRAEKGQSQAQLAAEMGVDIAHVQMYEQQRKPTPESFLNKYKRALDSMPTIENKKVKLIQDIVPQQPKTKMIKRKCLMCDREFFHEVNRICGKCKMKTAAWADI